ncbi:MAG TPA: SRPBCC family protein, partial [Egibacteraceae bacterium]|nr:SRPBCC family protein [Egibacteraceae bacterium]
QELVTGGGLLRRPQPLVWQWSRVAGDVAHLLLLANARGSGDSDDRRVRTAMAAVAGTTVVDLLAAVRLAREASAQREPVRARRAMTVRRPPEEVYRYWRDFSNLPTFMAHLQAVEVHDGGSRSHWVARAPAGTTVEWDAEITEDVPGEVIAWRSVEGADVPNRGSVRFASAPADQGTEVHVELHYDPPGGAVGAAVAKLFGEAPDVQLADDLRRCKQVLETGEVVRSDGSPDGSSTQRLLTQYPAQPAAHEGKKR